MPKNNELIQFNKKIPTWLAREFKIKTLKEGKLNEREVVETLLIFYVKHGIPKYAR